MSNTRERAPGSRDKVTLGNVHGKEQGFDGQYRRGRWKRKRERVKGYQPEKSKRMFYSVDAW